MIVREMTAHFRKGSAQIDQKHASNNRRILSRLSPVVQSIQACARTFGISHIVPPRSPASPGAMSTDFADNSSFDSWLSQSEVLVEPSSTESPLTTGTCPNMSVTTAVIMKEKTTQAESECLILKEMCAHCRRLWKTRQCYGKDAQLSVCSWLGSGRGRLCEAGSCGKRVWPLTALGARQDIPIDLHVCERFSLSQRGRVYLKVVIRTESFSGNFCCHFLFVAIGPFGVWPVDVCAVRLSLPVPSM